MSPEFVQNPSYHFNLNKLADSGGSDTRKVHYKKHFDNALSFTVKRFDDAEAAAKELGTSLHPLQDMVAHGDYGVTVKYLGDELAKWHNKWSPAKYKGKPINNFGPPEEYPDDPGLDAVDDEGKVDLDETHGSPVRAVLKRTQEGKEFAIYKHGTERIRYTAGKTLEALGRFKTSVLRFGGPKCKQYFFGSGGGSGG